MRMTLSFFIIVIHSMLFFMFLQNNYKVQFKENIVFANRLRCQQHYYYYLQRKLNNINYLINIANNLSIIY